jgi:hypothetical protein
LRLVEPFDLIVIKLILQVHIKVVKLEALQRRSGSISLLEKYASADLVKWEFIHQLGKMAGNRTGSTDRISATMHQRKPILRMTRCSGVFRSHPPLKNLEISQCLEGHPHEFPSSKLALTRNSWMGERVEEVQDRKSGPYVHITSKKEALILLHQQLNAGFPYQQSGQSVFQPLQKSSLLTHRPVIIQTHLLKLKK